jgi:Molybdopterin converting factor, large subunit
MSSAFYHLPAVDEWRYITDEPINLAAVLSKAHRPGAGAVVLFSGETRDTSEGKAVWFLEYEAHPSMAAKMIRDILQEAIDRWGLHFAIAQHRTGVVNISDSAVVVVTGAPHRSEAYAANRFIIDKIKHEVPIWKCEHFTDGTKVWSEGCNHKEKVAAAEEVLSDSVNKF